jgi:hypothetical protein
LGRDSERDSERVKKSEVDRTLARRHLVILSTPLAPLGRRRHYQRSQLAPPPQPLPRPGHHRQATPARDNRMPAINQDSAESPLRARESFAYGNAERPQDEPILWDGRENQVRGLRGPTPNAEIETFTSSRTSKSNRHWEAENVVPGQSRAHAAAAAAAAASLAVRMQTEERLTASTILPVKGWTYLPSPDLPSPDLHPSLAVRLLNASPIRCASILLAHLSTLGSSSSARKS